MTANYVQLHLFWKSLSSWEESAALKSRFFIFSDFNNWEENAALSKAVFQWFGLQKHNMQLPICLVNFVFISNIFNFFTYFYLTKENFIHGDELDDMSPCQYKMSSKFSILEPPIIFHQSSLNSSKYAPKNY